MPALANSVVLADSEAVMGIIPDRRCRRTLPDGGAPPAAADAGG
jgi:hypothetical protein